MLKIKKYRVAFLVLMLTISLLYGVYHLFKSSSVQEQLQAPAPLQEERRLQPEGPLQPNKPLQPEKPVQPHRPLQPDGGGNNDAVCKVKTPIEIKYTEIKQDEPCEAKFCPTLEGNQRKIASYNLSAADPYMPLLEPKPNLESVYKGPGTSNIEIPVFVGGASSNHFGEGVRLIKHLNTLIRPAYPTMKLFIFDLGLTPSEKKQFGDLCNCTLVTFPFEKYPVHVRKLFSYCWKPLVIKQMLQTYRFVMWMDTSVLLRTADLDPLFIQAKEQGVMSRCDAHLLASHTIEDTFLFLEEPPCLYKKYKEFIGRLLIFHSDHKVVNEYIIKPWIKCALTEECMKTKRDTGGRLLYCQSHKIYHSCHRYDQAILSLFIYRLYSDSYMDHHIEDKYFLPI